MMSEINPKLHELVSNVLIDFFDRVNDADFSEFQRYRNNVVVFFQAYKEQFLNKDSSDNLFIDETIDYLFTLQAIPEIKKIFTEQPITEKKTSLPEYLIHFSYLAFLTFLFVLLTNGIINEHQTIIGLICFLIGRELGGYFSKEN